MTPLEELVQMKEKAGVNFFHEKGFRGKGITILNCESGRTSHGAGTANILKMLAPEATILTASTGINTKGDALLSAQVELDGTLERIDLHQFIKERGVDIISASKSGITDTCAGWNAYCKRMQDDTGVVIFNAAGNNGSVGGETISSHFPPNVAILVGALNLKQERCNYSSVGQELDFTAFSGMIGGTSAATPFLAGMMAVIMSRYRKLSPREAYDYLVSISLDLGEPGDDIYYGEGMPMLPKKTTIDLQIGSPVMRVDGVDFLLDQAPVIDRTSGRTLVPVRAIAEGFGATVGWEPVTKSIRIEG